MVVHADMTAPHGVTFWQRVEAMLPRHPSGAVITPQREPPKGKRPFHPWCRFSDFKHHGVFGIGFGTKLPRFYKLKFTLVLLPLLAASEGWRRQHIRRSLIYNPVSWILNPEVFWAWDSKSPADFENNDDLREHIRTNFNVDPDTLVGLLAMSHRPMGGGVASYFSLRPRAVHSPGEKVWFIHDDFPLRRLFRWWRVSAIDEKGVQRNTRADELDRKRVLDRHWPNSDVPRNPLYDDSRVVNARE